MRYIPSIINCPNCSCFHGPKEVRGNLPCMICTTCEAVFMKDTKTILKPGKEIDGLA